MTTEVHPVTTDQRPSAMDAPRTTRTPEGKRFGYVVAIAINAVMLYIVHHLLAWEWPRFLTPQFEQLIPIVTVSLVATIVANAAFVFYDAGWFKLMGNTVTTAIAFVVAWRTLAVFPFDFSSYSHDWTNLTRVVLIAVMVATAIAVVVQVLMLITSPVRGHTRD